MKRYTLKDFGRAMGMTKGELTAYKKSCAWNDKMARIFKAKPGAEAPADPGPEEGENHAS